MADITPQKLDLAKVNQLLFRRPVEVSKIADSPFSVERFNGVGIRVISHYFTRVIDQDPAATKTVKARYPQMPEEYNNVLMDAEYSDPELRIVSLKFSNN